MTEEGAAGRDAGGAFFAGLLVGLFLTLPGGCFSRPGFGPAADPLSCRATRKRGKEARPKLPTTLRFAAGDLRWAGCGVCRRTHSLRLRRNPFKQLRQARQRSSPVLRQGCHPASRPTQAWAEGGRLGQPTANSQQPTANSQSIAALAFKPGPSEAKARTTSRMSAPAAWWLRGCSPAEGQDCFVI